VIFWRSQNPEGPLNVRRRFPIASRLTTLLACAVVVCSPNAWAQGEISGRVIAADSGRPPIQDVEASIPKLGRVAMSDSSGRFRLTDIPPGEYLMVLRAIGFKAESTTVFIDRDEVVSRDIVLTRSTGTVLPERVVTAPEARTPARLVEFMERQKAGFGHFITREQLAGAESGQRLTGDLIALVPGVRVRRGGNKIWVASGRAINAGHCVFCTGSVNRVDYEAGARPACYLDVYIDALLVFDSRHPENGLFDVNILQPEHIAGIEVYTSASQVPAKYNRTAGGCGVLLIWTR
jgi:carboxypeptidase family protein